MPKRGRGDDRGQAPSPQMPPAAPGNLLALATLGGMVAILVISFSNWREIDRIQQSIDGELDDMGTRIAQVNTQLGQMSNKINNLSAGNAQQARSGPDPNRVYNIKTDGAPYRGNAAAPVTIAEFSDFQ